MKSIIREINSGLPLSQAMKNSQLFPARVTHMVSIGENSGSLSVMLKKIAEIHQDSLDHTLDNLSQLLEPIIMMILSIVVGGLIIAMYLPVFKIGMVI